MKKLALVLAFLAYPAQSQTWIEYESGDRQMIALAVNPLIVVGQIVVPLGIFIECRNGAATVRVDPAEVADMPWIELNGGGTQAITSMEPVDNFGAIALFDTDFIAPAVIISDAMAFVQIIDVRDLREILPRHREVCGF